MSSKGHTAAVTRDLTALERAIALPAKPVEVMFEQISMGTEGGLGPSDYLLIALLRFSPENLVRVATLGVERPTEPGKISGRAIRPWFPPEVQAALGPPGSELGAVTVDGRKFDGALFARAPFTQGYFFILARTPYVLLVLQTT